MKTKTVTSLRVGLVFLLLMGVASPNLSAFEDGQEPRFEYRLLATVRVGTLEKEMNEAAQEGFRFEAIMGGETSFGGNETVVIMSRPVGPQPVSSFGYKLLATQKTSSLRKEMNKAGQEGYEFRGHTTHEGTFGTGIVAVMELDRNAGSISPVSYQLLATQKTSTMQKELAEAAGIGFEFVDMIVSKTKFGGKEIITVLRWQAPPPAQESGAASTQE